MQRWTKWLHSTKAITRIGVDLFHSKRPFGLSMPLHVWIPYTKTARHPNEQPDSHVIIFIFCCCCYWNGYFLALLLLLLFPTKSKGSWKQCLRIYLAVFNPSFKQKERDNKTARSCSFFSGKYPKPPLLGSDEQSRWLNGWYFFFFFFFPRGYVFVLGNALWSWRQTLCHLVWITHQ